MHVAGHSGGTASALLWAKMRGIPVLMELVNSTATPYQKIFGVFKITVPKNSKIAFLTQNQSKPFQNAFKNKIWIKPNPVDVDKFSYNGVINRDTQKVILSIAKFMPRKNQIFMIDVLKNLPANFKLILAGPAIKQGVNFDRDHKYFENILTLIGRHKLRDRVEIIQNYVESSEYMQRADIYVMPAWDEGLGTPMIEAMACGAPVVANEAEPAFQEWVKPSQNGFLEGLDSPELWAEAIIRASEFGADQKQKIANNVKNKASQEKIFSEYEDVFFDLIKI